MRELGGIRASRSVVRRLACAVCVAGWLGLATRGAVAQESGEIGKDHIRVLKGTHWFEERYPFASDSGSVAGIIRLKGTHWDASATQPREGAAGDGSVTVDALFPALRFPPADNRPHDNPCAEFLPKFGGDPTGTSGAQAGGPGSHVTVVVVPTILPLPPHDGPAGGNEASEPHLSVREKEPSAAAIVRSPTSHATDGEEPESRPQPAPKSSSYSAGLVQFASTAAGVLVALLLFCAGLVALRRLGVSVQFGESSQSGQPAAPPGLQPAPEAVVWEDTASNFDLGPTYEEEMRQREAAALDQEQAVLRQLFEQNVRLREQIGELDHEV
jgi:hypothetical protein